MIDTIHGAKSSAIIYSIVETAKTNNLKPFDYVHHLLEEIPKHMNDKDCSFLEVNIPVRQHRKSGRRETVCPGLRKPLMRVYSRNVLSKP